MKIETRDFAPHVVRTGWTEEDGTRVALVVQFGLHYIRGNRMPYFSITADVYENGRWTAGGCCHELIAERLPELRDVIALHLCSMDGSPMYAESNGWYWLAGVVDVGERFHGGNGSDAKSADECLRIFADHVRIPKAEAAHIIGRFAKQVKDEGRDAARKAFGAWIDTQRPRWKEEANALIRKYGFGIYGDMSKTPEEVLERIAAAA